MNTPPHQVIQQLHNPPPVVQNQQQQQSDTSDSDSEWSLASDNFGTPPPSVNSEDVSSDSHFEHENLPWNENNQEESSRPILSLLRPGVFVYLEYMEPPEPVPQNNAILNVLQEANMISQSSSENSQ